MILLVNCMFGVPASIRTRHFISMQRARYRSRFLSARTLSSTYPYLNDHGDARNVNGPLKISAPRTRPRVCAENFSKKEKNIARPRAIILLYFFSNNFQSLNIMPTIVCTIIIRTGTNYFTRYVLLIRNSHMRIIFTL